MIPFKYVLVYAYKHIYACFHTERETKMMELNGWGVGGSGKSLGRVNA